ncbi:MAG: DNA alkylation repair protein [bacterium]
MHLLHGQLLVQIQRVAKEDPVVSKLPENYGGNNHFSYGLNSSQLLTVVKDVVGNTKMSPEEIKRSVISFYKGESSEEKYAASRILQVFKDVRKIVSPNDVGEYLNYLHGWAEVDSLCQMVFDVEEFENDWEGWKDLVIKLSKDRNINKRRASLVLLVKPLMHSNNEKYLNLAIENLNRLKTERDKLITKAVSWILRSMIKNHRQELQRYLVINQKSLPAIAVRETRTKLVTGRK